MRPSTVIALIGGASLAAASPIAHLKKKAVVWDIVYETVFVTVTSGNGRSTKVDDATTVIVQSTVIVSPIPAPTPKPVAPAPAPVQPQPAPTPAAPAPAPVVPTPAAAPVVQAPAPEVQAPAPEVVQAPAPVQAAAVAPAAAAPPTDLVSSGLAFHNQHRRNHAATDLTWDDSLANSAQVLADRCVFGHDTTIGGGGYGQNIASQGTVGNDGSWKKGKLLASSIEQWYAEEPLFVSSYGQTQPSSPFTETGHFTQIVWKDTTRLGCGVSDCGTQWITVCNYASAGNFRGEYKDNVARPASTAVALQASQWPNFS